MELAPYEKDDDRRGGKRVGADLHAPHVPRTVILLLPAQVADHARHVAPIAVERDDMLQLADRVGGPAARTHLVGAPQMRLDLLLDGRRRPRGGGALVHDRLGLLRMLRDRVEQHACALGLPLVLEHRRQTPAFDVE